MWLVNYNKAYFLVSYCMTLCISKYSPNQILQQITPEKDWKFANLILFYYINDHQFNKTFSSEIIANQTKRKHNIMMNNKHYRITETCLSFGNVKIWTRFKIQEIQYVIPMSHHWMRKSEICSHPEILSHTLELKWESFNLCGVSFYRCDMVG